MELLVIDVTAVPEWLRSGIEEAEVVEHELTLVQWERDISLAAASTLHAAATRTNG